jgi:hypothetical protein
MNFCADARVIGQLAVFVQSPGRAIPLVLGDLARWREYRRMEIRMWVVSDHNGEN